MVNYIIKVPCLAILPAKVLVNIEDMIQDYLLELDTPMLGGEIHMELEHEASQELVDALWFAEIELAQWNESYPDDKGTAKALKLINVELVKTEGV